MKGKTRGLR